mmetsp:Transcript_27082/g.90084  ORF Transcript_27082/g.90084 Transcript_27082/m.90084 type:complete len:239 (-) Transcript_27082:4371-5087(-)
MERAWTWWHRAGAACGTVSRPPSAPPAAMGAAGAPGPRGGRCACASPALQAPHASRSRRTACATAQATARASTASATARFPIVASIAPTTPPHRSAARHALACTCTTSPHGSTRSGRTTTRNGAIAVWGRRSARRRGSSLRDSSTRAIAPPSLPKPITFMCHSTTGTAAGARTRLYTARIGTSQPCTPSTTPREARTTSGSCNETPAHAPLSGARFGTSFRLGPCCSTGVVPQVSSAR